MAISIHQLDQANSLARNVRDLGRQLKEGNFGVQVNPAYRNDETLAAIDAAIRDVLQARIDALRAALVELGVDVG